MNKLIDLYDKYDLRVRMSVGIIILAPIILSLFLLIPATRSISFTAVILVISFGICNLIISASRYYGRNAVKKCFTGALPAQRMLHPDDYTLDAITKSRYQKYLSTKIEGLSFDKDASNLNDTCNTAINWLISQTRDSNNFPIIKEELINFGFSKNLYGVKPFGITISSILTIIEFLLIYFQYKLTINIFDTSCLIVSAIISICFLLMWIFVVNKNWVIENGKKYAISLLSACDSPYLNS